ncbi:MAG: SIS domain-containing protein [Planctomycetales bacterium]
MHPESPDFRLGTIRTHLVETARVQRRTIDACSQQILDAADMIVAAFRDGGRLLLCGNGGSAADCQHLAAEFTSRLDADFARPPLPAIALTTDTSFLTAYANDFSFDGIFARQIEAHAKPSDVLLAISTSGKSRNILRALETAIRMELGTILLTGNGIGDFEFSDSKPKAQITIRVPSRSTQHIQETHLAIEHLLCHLVERELFCNTTGPPREALVASG